MQSSAFMMPPKAHCSRQSNLAELFSPASGGTDRDYTWSPSGKFVLRHGFGCMYNGKGIPIPDADHAHAAIFGSDGSCFKFNVDPRSERLRAGWSPCGRYVHLTSTRCNQPDGFNSTSIWDVLQKTYVYSLREPNTGHQLLVSNNVTWPEPTKQRTERTTCLMTGHNMGRTLLTLPCLSDSSGAETVQLHPPDTERSPF